MAKEKKSTLKRFAGALCTECFCAMIDIVEQRA